MKPLDQKIYLASKSPRRRELLRQIGVDFELLMLRETPGREGALVNEDPLPAEAPADYVTRVARHKADLAREVMLWRRLPPRPILSADTMVTLDNEILGKPADREQAMAMLARLSGRIHQVMTSVVLIVEDNAWQATQVSSVRFAPLSQEQMQSYCLSNEPYDKAGGYGIQGHAAAVITEIQGSYSSIMGLPLYETAQLLTQAGLRNP